MKVRVTKKTIKENYNIIIGAGYCQAQTLLTFEQPRYYSSNVYGWACDYYHINDMVIISTGYDYIDNTKGEHNNIIKEAEKKAQKIYHDNEFSWLQKKKKITKLLNATIEKIARKELPWWELED